MHPSLIYKPLMARSLTQCVVKQSTLSQRAVSGRILVANLVRQLKLMQAQTQAQLAVTVLQSQQTLSTKTL